VIAVNRIMSMFLILLYSCVQVPAVNHFYSNYSEYKKSVAESKIMERYSLYFDAALVNNVDINDPSTASQLAFANYMIEEVSHYELTLNNKGCLTVNGLDADKAPVTNGTYLTQFSGFSSFRRLLKHAPAWCKPGPESMKLPLL